MSKLIAQTALTLKKHTPLILTGVAAVGTVTTAVTAYKAAKKVEFTLDKYEELEEGVDYQKKDLIIDLAKDVAIPVTAGVVTIGALVGSYAVQNKRVGALSSALTLAVAEHRRYRSRAREVLDEATFAKVDTPQETQEVKVGKEKVNVSLPKEGDFFGKWFMHSTKYVSDDPNYNEVLIREVIDLAEQKLNKDGVLLYADLMTMLGFTHASKSLPFGWTDRDQFYLEYTENQTWNESKQDIQVEHYISWQTPRNLYA